MAIDQYMRKNTFKNGLCCGKGSKRQALKRDGSPQPLPPHPPDFNMKKLQELSLYYQKFKNVGLRHILSQYQIESKGQLQGSSVLYYSRGLSTPEQTIKTNKLVVYHVK